MAVLIGHASLDERRKAKGGVAGDQSKKEVFTQNWYPGDWDFVIRFTDSKVANNAAIACEKACKNDKIGYDQSQRNNLLFRAREVDFDLSKITKACECDCSALMCVCAIAAGVPEKYLFIDGVLRRTKNMRAAFKKIPGVKILTQSKYLTSDKYLKRGDILVKERKHTVMVLSDGSQAVKKFEPYIVRVNTDALNIRKGPGMTYVKVGIIKDRGAYTIVEEKKVGLVKWGLLKSGAETRDRWISLKYVKKVK